MLMGMTMHSTWFMIIHEHDMNNDMMTMMKMKKKKKQNIMMLLRRECEGPAQ